MTTTAPAIDEDDAAHIGSEFGEDVVVEVDYAIIRHFSEYLYGSPNKAIEELVSNSYDALAQRCDVFIPGNFTSDRVIVWDSGQSMGIDDLKALWVIARSPKQKPGAREAKDGSIQRLMIGKFGIGKLASYALGQRITHYCHVDDEYLAVTVDYRDVSADLDNQEPLEQGEADLPDTDSHTAPLTAVQSVNHSEGPGLAVPEYAASNKVSRYATPIRKLTETEARSHLRGLFDEVPKDFESQFSTATWTIAVVDLLKENELSQGRLSWVLGMGMPLRPDFKLFVNEKEVVSRLSAGATTTWDLTNEKVLSAVQAAWTAANLDVDPRRAVSGSLEVAPADLSEEESISLSGRDPGLAVRFPSLGLVTAEVRLFDSSLARSADTDKPRSYGFFAMVRGRLINPDDDRLLLPDPSFSTFYRSQFVIRADGLDMDLLADRERIKVDTGRARELRVLQQGMYRAARAELERLDFESAVAATSQSLLPVDSRELFREPITALLMRDENSSSSFPLSQPAVTRTDISEAAQMSDLDPDGGGFRVNSAHPFYRSVLSKAGKGKVGSEFLRVFDLFAVSERLLEGHLYDVGLDDLDVSKVLEWRDQLFRALAGRYAAASAEVIEEVRQTSYLGKAPFEDALAKMFNFMGFSATRDGASGQKDVLVVAPIGPDAARFTLEAKGSKHPVQNDATDIDISAAHRTAAGASHSIIVAREFAGFSGYSNDPMVLQQLREVQNVSIVTVECLAVLFEAVQTYSYPLDVILPVLTIIESPQEKLARVHGIADPLVSFDLRGLLDAIWEQQQGVAEGDLVSVRTLWQTLFKPNGVSLEQLRAKLSALETLADGLVQFKAEQNDVHIRQAPDMVAARIERSLEAIAESLSSTE